MEKRELQSHRLPVPDWLWNNIAEASKKNSKIHAIYIAVLLYTVIIVGSVTDSQLITNKEISLPVLQTHIPLNLFLYLAPFIITFAFLYFQIYFQKLTSLLNCLEKYSDKNKNEKLYPWIFIFIHDHVGNLIGSFKQIVIIFSLFFATPISLIFIEMFYIKKHGSFKEFVYNNLINCCILLVNVASIKGGIHWLPKFENKYQKRLYYILRISSFGLLLVTTSLMIYQFYALILQNQKDHPYYLRNIDLSYQQLVDEKLSDYNTVYLLDLRDVHLENADLTGTILRRADMRHSFLQGAKLVNTLLTQAWLDGANLSGTLLKTTQFGDAKLNRVKFDGAYFEDAGFNQRSELHGASFIGAKMRGFYAENLQCSSAVFQKAELQNAQIKRSNLKHADFSKANLDSAILSDVIMDGAICKNASFIWVNFHETSLNDVNFEGADLTNARDLTFAQLIKVKTLYNAKLDGEMLSYIRQFKPDLLERPFSDK